MKYLGKAKTSWDVEKVLSNWLTTAGIIYQDETTIDDLSAILHYEVTHKHRALIVDRVKIRLLSLIKAKARTEIEAEIKELKRVSKGQAKERIGKEH